MASRNPNPAELLRDHIRDLLAKLNAVDDSIRQLKSAFDTVIETTYPHHDRVPGDSRIKATKAVGLSIKNVKEIDEYMLVLTELNDFCEDAKLHTEGIGELGPLLKSIGKKTAGYSSMAKELVMKMNYRRMTGCRRV